MLNRSRYCGAGGGGGGEEIFITKGCVIKSPMEINKYMHKSSWNEVEPLSKWSSAENRDKTGVIIIQHKRVKLTNEHIQEINDQDNIRIEVLVCRLQLNKFV